MKMSQSGLNLIKRSEGFRAKPYRCPAGIPTIGYGSTLYGSGRVVNLNDPEITTNEAQEILTVTLVKYEDAVNRYVQVQLTQGQFDALTDFAYNCGIGNLQTSTLLKKVNRRDFVGAAKEFGKWVNGGGRVLKGLVVRREAERQLFVA